MSVIVAGNFAGNAEAYSAIEILLGEGIGTLPNRRCALRRVMFRSHAEDLSIRVDTLATTSMLVQGGWDSRRKSFLNLITIWRHQ
jgi:hypothetical protein